MTSARVRAECLEQTNRSILRGAPLGLPASLVLANILGDSTPTSSRIALVVLVTGANVFGLVSVWAYRVRRRAGVEITRWWPIPAYGFLVGIAWSSVSLFGFPGPEHVELRAVIAMFAAGVSATQIVSAAAHRAYFYAAQIPLLGVMGVVFLASDERVTHLIGYAVLIYGIAMVSLHHDVNRIVVNEIELKHANRDLIADLTTQQHQTAEMNERLIAANSQLTERALRDSLTGLANRPALLDELERALAESHRTGAVVGVLFFDVDRFKIVNDSLGHAIGDELLVTLAARVGAVLRPGDTLGRFGGDEFVVLLPALADSYEAVLVAERVRGSLVEPLMLAAREVAVTVSVGVATNLHSSDGAGDLLRHADAAQYTAKQGGRDRVEVFDIELREKVQRLLDVERELRQAMTEGLVVPWFQPQVDLATGAIVGAEALARWVHPTRGVLGAPEFIPLAEEVGLIMQLDAMIIAQSIRARVALGNAGADASFRIWCNVSPAVLARGNQVQRLEGFLATVGCDPRGIGIEITETGVLVDIEAARRELTAARRLGLRVALDDFGTGHSSLSLLRDLPIDEVKIDRSFVRDLAVDPVDEAIVSGVASIAQRLGLEVVAEGVEYPEQEAKVRSYGCARAQGWRYGRPMPFDELVACLGLAGPAVPASVSAPA